jgi:hypothetical protein
MPYSAPCRQRKEGIYTFLIFSGLDVGAHLYVSVYRFLMKRSFIPILILCFLSGGALAQTSSNNSNGYGNTNPSATASSSNNSNGYGNTGGSTGTAPSSSNSNGYGNTGGANNTPPSSTNANGFGNTNPQATSSR